jgi:hypothetical protein
MTRLSRLICSHIIIGMIATLLTFHILTGSIDFLMDWFYNWPLIPGLFVSVIVTSIFRERQIHNRGQKRFLHYYRFSFLTIIISWIFFFLCSVFIISTYEAISQRSLDAFINYGDEYLLLTGGIIFLFYGIMHALSGGILLAFTLQRSKD